MYHFLIYQLYILNRYIDHKGSDSIRSLVYYQHYEKYGKLEAGTYRLTITIYDSNSKDLSNPNHRDFSVEFLVNDGENVFVYENEYPATETR